MFIDIDGIEVHYKDEGSGKVILLLHGWGCDLSFYQKIQACLSEGFRVISVDFPGFGQTGEPPIAWGVDEYSRFILQFIKQLAIDEVSLIGHSFGGRVIIKLASLYKEEININRIVLVDAAGIRPKKSLKSKIKIAAFKCGKKILSIPTIAKLYPDKLEELRSKSGSADYNAASPLMRQVLVKTVNEDLTPLISQIDRSTLLIWGELDTATPLKDAQKMNKLIQDSGLVVLKGGSHFAYIEQAGYVNVILTEFFKDISAKRV